MRAYRIRTYTVDPEQRFEIHDQERIVAVEWLDPRMSRGEGSLLVITALDEGYRHPREEITG